MRAVQPYYGNTKGRRRGVRETHGQIAASVGEDKDDRREEEMVGWR